MISPVPAITSCSTSSAYSSTRTPLIPQQLPVKSPPVAILDKLHEAPASHKTRAPPNFLDTTKQHFRPLWNSRPDATPRSFFSPNAHFVTRLSSAAARRGGGVTNYAREARARALDFPTGEKYRGLAAAAAAAAGVCAMRARE